MKYRVIKSSFDGISGGESMYNGIDEALREISFHKGWDSKEQLHASIRKWAKHARPGAVYTTQVSAVVALPPDRCDYEEDICHHCGHEGLDYDEMEPVGECDWDIQQKASCPECGERWLDTFVLSDRHALVKEMGKI